MSTLRDDVRAILRASWDGRSCGSIAAELGRETEQVRYSLRALKDRGEAVKDESGLWYLRQDGIVPEHVGIIRRLDPDVAEVEEQVLEAQEEDEPEVVTRPMPEVYHTPAKVIEAASGVSPLDEPQAIVELAEHLDRVSMVPTAELERPAPEPERMVTLTLTVTATEARRLLAMLP